MGKRAARKWADGGTEVSDVERRGGGERRGEVDDVHGVFVAAIWG
jgi:hypothetical protein